MKTFGSYSIDVLDSKIKLVFPRPRGKNKDSSMSPDFHNFRVVLIMVLQIIPNLIRLEIWDFFLHIVIYLILNNYFLN